MPCQATADAHCCWVDGVVCPHFDPDPPADAGGHCSLRTELGSWPAVHEDARFLEVWTDGTLCGEWTPETPQAQACPTCGWDGVD